MSFFFDKTTLVPLSYKDGIHHAWPVSGTIQRTAHPGKCTKDPQKTENYNKVPPGP
jgi:hypothetical protein